MRTDMRSMRHVVGIRSCRKRHTGLTLIELLVVFAIVGVLVALLLPNVRRGSTAARQVQCRNNLKQIGLALHNYHDVANGLPPGWIGENRWGWNAMILPQLDFGAIYDQLVFQTGKNFAGASANGYNALMTTMPASRISGEQTAKLRRIRTDLMAVTTILPTMSKWWSDVKPGICLIRLTLHQ